MTTKKQTKGIKALPIEKEEVIKQARKLQQQKIDISSLKKKYDYLKNQTEKEEKKEADKFLKTELSK